MKLAGIAGLAADRRAVSAVELGLIAPIFAMFLAALVDFSTGFSAKLQLEQAANRTMELATAPGKVQSSYTYLKAEAMEASGRPADAVTVSAWLECNGVRQDQLDGTCADGQQIARYVSVNITSVFTPMFNWQALWGADSADGIAINGDSVVRVQ